MAFPCWEAAKGHGGRKRLKVKEWCLRVTTSRDTQNSRHPWTTKSYFRITHKSESNPGFQYGSNWLHLNICLVTWTAFIFSVSCWCSFQICKYSSTNMKKDNYLLQRENFWIFSLFSAIAIDTFSPHWLMAQDWNQIGFLLLLFL